MQSFKIRTEDFKETEILGNYVQTARDKGIVSALMSNTPTIVEGSRGTGKSFLLRVAKALLLQTFPSDRVLPVYVAFAKSSLIQTTDKNQFFHWMLARLSAELIRALRKQGLLVSNPDGLSIIGAGAVDLKSDTSNVEQLAKRYEESYKSPGELIDPNALPSIEDFKTAVEDLCESLSLDRIVVMFDEAAHIFRPEQQRRFFTLFRDLRSPYISCNAAVYPGVTMYGTTFETSHDATILEINRNPFDVNYLSEMREIVAKQADANFMKSVDENRSNFEALSFAVSGNPRLLLKTISLAPKLKSGEIRAVFRDFYRSEIWSEHTGLGDKYPGHRELVDFGRRFVEENVIPETRSKNEEWLRESKSIATNFFWIHRDAPEQVKESLRLLAYTGIVTKTDSGIVATRSELGDRYFINLGCLVAPSANPIEEINQIARRISIKRFTEYGRDHSAFKDALSAVSSNEEPDMSSILSRQLSRSVDVLELSKFQRESLCRLGFETIGKALAADETSYQAADYIGPVRSRQMRNAVIASVLEYLSG